MKLTVIIKKNSKFKKEYAMRDKTLTKHHRKCKSLGGSDQESNISIVPHDMHVAFHKLFGNATAGQIARMLNNIWIDPGVKLVVVKKRLSND